MMVQVIDCCSGSVGVSTILLKSNPWIGIKRQHIRVHELIAVAIGSKAALDCMKGGFEFKGVQLHSVIILFSKFSL